MTDDFSRYCELVPLKTVDAASITQGFYSGWICRYGISSIVITDGAFDTNTFSEFLHLLQTRHHVSLPYHPHGHSS